MIRLLGNRTINRISIEEIFVEVGTVFRFVVDALPFVGIQYCSRLHLICLLRPRADVVEESSVFSKIAQLGLHLVEGVLDWNAGKVVEYHVDERFAFYFQKRVERIIEYFHFVLNIFSELKQPELSFCEYELSFCN